MDSLNQTNNLIKDVFGTNYLGVVDFLVVAGTLAFSLFIGLYFAFCQNRNQQQTNDDLLVGGRKMGAVPVAASLLVSYLSAITILGYPAEVYNFGTQVFMMTILGLVAYPLSIYLFVSVLYKLKLTSAYKYLELRFDSVVVRWMGSSIFILQLLSISGIVLYAPSIALETMVGIPKWISLVGIAICGTVYTSIGGIRAVVWTDAFQFVMIIVGMSAIVVKGFISAGGVTEAFKVAKDNGRLELVDTTVDPFMRHNTLNIWLGNGFSAICLIGTHQPIVQRYCSLPSFKLAVKSMILSYVFGTVTIGLVILTGIVIYAAYSECDPVLSGQIKKTDQIVPFFVVKELGFIPGMMGLFVSVIFSAVLSTISSTLNSLAAVTWDDFLGKAPWFRTMGDLGKTRTYKVVSIFFGIVIVLLAMVAENLGTIFQAAITVIGTFAGVQGSVFVMGVFMPFVNKFGAFIGTVTSLSAMGYLTFRAIDLQKTYTFQPKLPLTIDGCPDSMNMSMMMSNSTATLDSEVPWPDKLYTVSYLLYPLIGGVLAIIIGVIVSLITKECTSKCPRDSEYLHPLIRKKSKTENDSATCDQPNQQEINMNYIRGDEKIINSPESSCRL